MPRPAKPFFHRGWWVTDLGGQRSMLAQGRHNRKIAEQTFHELLAKPNGESEVVAAPQFAVWELCDEFLACQNGEQVVMYTARHTYATWAVASGVADRRLADLMGHTDPKMTQRYIHLPTDDLYRASLEATRGYISPK